MMMTITRDRRKETSVRRETSKRGKETSKR